jgi:signal recognition particle receptor subunit beta
VIVAVGRAFTVTTVAVLVEEHDEAFVTTTVYDPLAFAVYEDEVAPLIGFPFNLH